MGLRLPDLAMALACGFSLGTPVMLLWNLFRRDRRGKRHFARKAERKLEAAIPDSLDIIASGLSAGFSLQLALEEVCHQPSQPLAPLFSEIMVSVRSGTRLEEALRQAAGRFRGNSFPLVFLSLASTCRTGTNTIESLNHLARVCRDRHHIREQVFAKTAQGRMQGMILMCVPVLFLLALFIVSPSSLIPVLQSQQGRSILLAAAAFQALGAWSIRLMVAKELI